MNAGITDRDIIFQICPHCKYSGYKRHSHAVKWAGYLHTDAQCIPPPNRDAEWKRSVLSIQTHRDAQYLHSQICTLDAVFENAQWRKVKQNYLFSTYIERGAL